MAITKIQSESLNLSDTYDFTGTVTGAGGNNKPAFEAYNSSSQTISNKTNTIMSFDTEVYDTDNKYSSNRFTPGVAGRYFVFSKAHFGTGASNSFTRLYYSIYKNGSQYTMSNSDTRDAGTVRILGEQVFATLDLDTDDYVEINVYVEGGTANTISAPDSNEKAIFGAYKIIE